MLDREKIMDKVEFTDFVLKYEEKVREVADMLSLPFAETIPGLEKQISLLASKMEFISWCLAYSEAFLTNAFFKNLPVKRKDWNDMDRQAAVEFSIEKETLFRDWLKLMSKDVSTYLDKAQSILATKRLELEKLGFGGKDE